MGDLTDPEYLSSTMFIVIEDDEAIQELVYSILKDMGVQKIDMFNDGQEAWHALAKNVYGFVILDWKLQGVNGLTLYNRLRQNPKYWKVPILSISGFIQQKDFRLLEEFPFTRLLEKPFPVKNFKQTIHDLDAEIQWFNRSKSLIQQVLLGFDSEGDESVAALTDLLDKSPNPLPLALSFVRNLYDQHRFDDAEKVLIAVLRQNPESLIAKTELGRVYLNQAHFKKASDILSMAKDQSPQNVGRLCLIGQAKLNMADYDSARKHFEHVLEIDPEHEEAQVGCSVLKGIKEFKSHKSVNQAPQTFAALMNNIGISLVRTGNVEGGIDHYNAAWQCVFGIQSKVKISFNLGLGYLRQDYPEEAFQWFKLSNQLADGSFEKAKRYYDKLKFYYDDKVPEVDDRIKSPAKPQGYEEQLESIFGSTEHDEEFEKEIEGDFVLDSEPTDEQIRLYSDESEPDIDEEGYGDGPMGKKAAEIFQFKRAEIDQTKNEAIDESLPKNQEELKEQIPEITEIFEMLMERGQYIETHSQKFVGYIQEYGMSLFTAAIKVAITRQTPTSLGIEMILKQFSEVNEILGDMKKTGG